MVLRNDQLDAHDRCLDAADDEKQERIHNVKNAQLLVIHGDDPLVEAFAERPCAVVNSAECD